MVVGSPTKLNLIPSGVMPVVYINQGDAGYDKEFLVYNGDSPYNVPSGVSATIRGKKADGYGVTEAAALTEGSNLVTVTITEQMVAAEGANLYELVFVDTDGLRIATINMVWAVKADALGDAVISESDLDYASQVLDQLQSVQAFKNQLDSNTDNIEANTDGLAAETAARIAADATLQSDINTEASTRAATDTSLQAQINQIVAPSGEAPSAAEVQNARIGADGVTYQTLGDAIRANDTELKNHIKAMYPIKTGNQFTWTLGKTVNSAGTYRDNLSTATTNIFSVEADNGLSIFNASNPTGMNDLATLFHVNEYIDGVWQARHILDTGEGVTLSASTNGVRLTFGYAANSGVVETQADIDAHCAALFISESATKEEVSNMQDQLDVALTLSHTYADTIGDGTDYDTLTTAGNYSVTTAAHARTMINCPVTVAHRLIVLTTSGSSQVKQIVIANASKLPIWVRNNTEPWFKLVTDDIVLKQMTSFVTGTTGLPFTNCDDAPLNTIFTVNGSAAVSNLPPGNNNAAGAGDTYGTASGILITFGGATYNDSTSVTQFYISQAQSPWDQPVFNFRCKFYSNQTWKWTPWSKIAGYGFLHATNTFIQESRIQAGTAMFSDMNDAPNNTIVQIDLDAVSMANNPLSGHSCVLITFSASYISRHGSFQLCMGLDNGAHLFFRYGYQQSTTEYRWTPWRETVYNEVAQNIPALPSADGHYTLGVTITNGVPVFDWE